MVEEMEDEGFDDIPDFGDDGYYGVSTVSEPESDYVTKINYEIYCAEDVEKKFQALISQVREILGNSDDDCILLLKYFRWNVDKLEQNIFDNKAKIEIASGTILDPNCAAAKAIVSTGNCAICWDTLGTQPDFLICKHAFCDDCWGGYLSTLVKTFSN
jgi:ariadne-1